MKLLHSSADIPLIGHLQSVLENRGIGCWIKNQVLSAGMGELPPNECWPQLWLHHDEDYKNAMEIISPIISPSQTKQASWECDCGEKLEGQFEICWNCGNERTN